MKILEANDIRVANGVMYLCNDQEEIIFKIKRIENRIAYIEKAGSNKTVRIPAADILGSMKSDVVRLLDDDDVQQIINENARKEASIERSYDDSRLPF